MLENQYPKVWCQFLCKTIYILSQKIRSLLNTLRSKYLLRHTSTNWRSFGALYYFSLLIRNKPPLFMVSLSLSQNKPVIIWRWGNSNFSLRSILIHTWVLWRTFSTVNFHRFLMVISLGLCTVKKQELAGICAAIRKTQCFCHLYSHSIIVWSIKTCNFQFKSLHHCYTLLKIQKVKSQTKIWSTLNNKKVNCL
jgi:hypothetical protein